MFLKECKDNDIEKKMLRYITGDPEIFSDDSDESDEE